MMRRHNSSMHTDAAQVDHDLLAPEYDRSGDAPQVHTYHAPGLLPSEERAMHDQLTDIHR